VKGFTEALIADFRMHAPHIRVSVIMPGHIGTGQLAVATHHHARFLLPRSVNTRASGWR